MMKVVADLDNQSLCITSQGPQPTPTGGGLGDQCLLKRGIFLFRLEQLKIGFGWGSMAPIWNGTGLRKPHALPNLRLTHWVPC